MCCNRLTTFHGIICAVCGVAPMFGRSVLQNISMPSFSIFSTKPSLSPSTNQLGITLCLIAAVDIYRSATIVKADLTTVAGNAVWSLVSLAGALTNSKDLNIFLQQAAFGGLFAVLGIVSLYFE